MSPMGRIEARLPIVGRIRLGTRERTKSGKIAPRGSEHLIFSSESKGTLTRLSAHVGGAVEAWPDGPDAWRLISTIKSLAVQVPPMMMREPVYELWSAAGIQRRCDGVECERAEETPDGPVLLPGPCICDPEHPECKMTVRVSVVIAQAPGLGVWMCTSHSTIAAGEIAGQRRLLELTASPALLPATIAIEQSRGRQGAPVPVLRLRFHVGLAEIGSVEAPRMLGA